MAKKFKKFIKFFTKERVTKIILTILILYVLYIGGLRIAYKLCVNRSTDLSWHLKSHLCAVKILKLF